MSGVRKEKLKESIDELDAVEHKQIFAILKKYTADYTRTDTGVYITLDKLPAECLEEVSAYIKYCKDQRKFMEEDSKRRLKYEAMLRQ